MKMKMKIISAASALAVLLEGCTITPIQTQPVAVTPVYVTPGPVTPVYVTPGPVVVEPEFIDVGVPGVWIMNGGGHSVWHPLHHDPRPNPRHHRPFRLAAPKVVWASGHSNGFCGVPQFTSEGAPRPVKGWLRNSQKESINILGSLRLSAKYIKTEIGR